MDDVTVKEASPIEAGSVVGSVAEPVTDDQIIQHFLENDLKVLELRQKFDSLLLNLDFLIDDPWIDSVIKGLKKRDIDERLEKQLKKTVRKKLMDEAYEEVKPGESIQTPTQEEIDKRVKVHLDKRDKEIKSAKDSKLRKARNAIKASI